MMIELHGSKTCICKRDFIAINSNPNSFHKKGDKFNYHYYGILPHFIKIEVRHLPGTENINTFFVKCFSIEEFKDVFYTDESEIRDEKIDLLLS